MGTYTHESAKIVLKQAGAEPLETYPNSQAKKWKCLCLNCKRIIYPRLGNIRIGSKACRFCYGPNPVKESEAIENMRKSGVEPLEPYPGFDLKWRVRWLSCGHESTPLYCNILKGQGGCFRCGRDYGEKPAIVYLFHNKEKHLIKIGISNQYGSRLDKYAGWERIEVINLNTGKEAAIIEAEVLHLWRYKLGLGIKATDESMPHGGYTETADDAGLEAAVQILNKYKNIPSWAHLREMVSISNFKKWLL